MAVRRKKKKGTTIILHYITLYSTIRDLNSDNKCNSGAVQINKWKEHCELFCIHSILASLSYSR
jgi:hypothetical protein